MVNTKIYKPLQRLDWVYRKAGQKICIKATVLVYLHENQSLQPAKLGSWLNNKIKAKIHVTGDATGDKKLNETYFYACLFTYTGNDDLLAIRDFIESQAGNNVYTVMTEIHTNPNEGDVTNTISKDDEIDPKG